MFEIGDLECLPFQIAELEEGTVQVGNVSEFGRDCRCSFPGVAGKDLEEQLLQIVEVPDEVSV